MAAKDTSTLIYELTELALDLDGAKAEELQDAIYKLLGAPQAEEEKATEEWKRLKELIRHAKAGRSDFDTDKATPRWEAIKKESTTKVMNLMTVSNGYKGPRAVEVKNLVRQLPRAAKAEREPIEAEMKRLQVELAGLKRVSRPDPYQAERASQDMKRVIARRSSSPAQAHHTQQLQTDRRRRAPDVVSPSRSPGMVGPPSAPAAMRSSRPSRETSLQTPSSSRFEPEHPSASSGTALRQRSALSPTSGRTLNARDTSVLSHRRHNRYAPVSSTTPSDRGQAASIDPRLQARESENRKRRLSAAEPTSAVPPLVKRRRVPATSVECQLTCGRCKRYDLECNGMPRCNNCTGFCVYHTCTYGDMCHVQSCTRIHPDQWETDKGGQQYAVQGINVHTRAPGGRSVEQ